MNEQQLHIYHLEEARGNVAVYKCRRCGKMKHVTGGPEKPPSEDDDK